MPVAVTLTFSSEVTADQYWAVNDKLGIDMRAGTGDVPAGLLSHWGGVAEDGSFVVSEVWESRAVQEAFAGARLGAALAAVGIPEPLSVVWVQPEGYQAFAG